MDVLTFINNYQEAFSAQAELPIAFWYSDEAEALTEKVNGCFFKCMKLVRSGNPVSLSSETITCGGGKFYTGFTEMPERVPGFVSLKERYKQTPEMVLDFIEETQVPRTNKTYLNFARIDLISSFDKVEGLLFFATPDILSGLTTWAYFDNNAKDAVSTPFGSGCSSVVTQAILENEREGKRTFLGFFDPSVRPHFEENILSFTIPMFRFKEMYDTMRQSCLFDTHAWAKIKTRIKNTPKVETPYNKTLLSFSILPDISLREVNIDDAADIYHAIDTHRDYLRTWLPFVDHLKSIVDEENFLKSILSVPEERHEPTFAVCNERNEICGLIGFHFTDFANHRTEIGYWLLPEYQHRGVMTAAVRRLCQWAMEDWNMQRIQIRCAVGNDTSNGIPIRLGLRHEGIELAGELLSSGKYADIQVYSLLKGDWD